MKKLIQLLLFLLIPLLGFLFYINYFESDKKIKENKLNDIKKELSSTESDGNLIKNLRYNVNFDNNTQYIIMADFSEITYENNTEIVKMSKVTATFVDKNGIPLVITSDNAIYNGSNYNTNFDKNVRVNYIDNVILSDNLDLKFNENIIKIYNNVVYEGIQGIIKSDNVIFDLITKNMKVFMKNSKDKVEGVSK
jgi:hypothetical protein